jgi:hypothetical protein
MKRWAIATVALYVIALVLLTTPAFLVGFAGWAPPPDPAGGFDIGDLLDAYAWYGTWIWLAVLAGGQALFLLVPIHIAERRLPARRPVKLPAIATGFFLANLLFGAALSIGCVFLGVDALGTETTTSYSKILLVCVVVSWVLWTFVFRRFANSDDPAEFINRSIRWLLRGSILELLVAVPSHIIVRRRGDCCAPVGTFWGIVTGTSVMLLCFGPGVFFLFAERFRRLKPKGGPK